MHDFDGTEGVAVQPVKDVGNTGRWGNKVCTSLSSSLFVPYGICWAIKLNDQVLESSLWLLSFIFNFLSCSAVFNGSFAACCSGMRSWPLEQYVVFLTCFKTKGWSPSLLPISCLMYCRSHSQGSCFSSVSWLACSMFVFHSCDSSEASGINLMDKSMCENRNRISNPQNLVFVQFKWKISKFLKRGVFPF